MEAPHPTAAAMEALKDEQPRISDAMKNFCSVLAATDLVTPKTPSAANAGPNATKGEQQRPHDFKQLIGIAKVVLQAINAHELLAPDAWAQRHPQGDDESGAARIEALTAYKACSALRAHAASALGTSAPKLTKLLGRGYLRATRCWTDGVHAAAAAELARLRFPPHTVDAFLDGWSKAVDPAQGLDVADDVAGLVWAADFNGALQARRLARDREVAERRARMESGEAEADALREALAAEERMAAEEEEEPRMVEV